MSKLTLKFFDLFPEFEDELKKNFKDQTKFKLENTNLEVEMVTCNIFALPEYREPEKYPKVAFVSPANSFGWMNGGIDAPLAKKILPGIEKNLQEILEKLDYHGELETGYTKEFLDHMMDSIKTIFQVDINLGEKSRKFLEKEGKEITIDNFVDDIDSDFINKYFPRHTPDYHLPVGSALLVEHLDKNQFLISAPTMFFPQDVRNTHNAYFAMIAILKVVEKYNKIHQDQPITEILCPGLCTGVGGLSFKDLAVQLHDAILDYQKGIKDSESLNLKVLKSFEDKFPDTLYLRESAYHQSPLKSGMLNYILKSMFHKYDEPRQLIESQFENNFY